MSEMISIITVSYNCCNNIENTIRSVLSLKFPNIEYIIVDGGSNDGTVDIIRKYSNMISYFISEPDKGIYDAMNKGINKAKGDWVYFLNSGDFFVSDDVFLDINFEEYYNDSKKCGIICKVKVFKEQGIVDFCSSTPFYRNNKHNTYSMGFSHQGVLIKTKLARLFMFDIKYKLCADFDMMMRLHTSGYQFIEINKVICIVEGRNGASSANRKLQFKEEAMVLGVSSTIRYKMDYCIFLLKQFIKNHKLL